MMKWIEDTISIEVLLKLAGVVFALIVFFSMYRIFCKYLKKIMLKKVKPQTSMLIEKIIKYVFMVCVVLYVLDLFGINLSALLGAAGIAGVAIGFAAQTSFSNIISGFFVLSEHTFQLGDFITVGDTSGTVCNIDLLSVKIQTPDNQMIRIPNETIIQSNLINTSFNPQRRMLLKVKISYDSDLEHIEQLLLSIARNTSKVLETPSPVVIFDSFADSCINAQLGVWFKKDDFLDVKNSIFKNVHQKLKENGVIMPFSQLDVHLDSQINT